MIDSATSNILLKTFSILCKWSMAMKINKSKPLPGINSSGSHSVCVCVCVMFSPPKPIHLSSVQLCSRLVDKYNCDLVHICLKDYKSAREKMQEKWDDSSLYSPPPLFRLWISVLLFLLQLFLSIFSIHASSSYLCELQDAHHNCAGRLLSRSIAPFILSKVSVREASWCLWSGADHNECC